MAAGATAFQQYFDRPPPASSPPREAEVHPSWRSWESWMTLVLIILVQLPVVGSLQSANWVDEMPSLMAPAAIGLAAAWALGHTRLSGLAAAGIGILVGAIATVGLVMQTMQLADPTATGVTARWAEFRLRLLEWGRALLDGGFSADSLPFVVMLIASVYVVGFLSTWAVVRWRNPWVALVPGGFVLLTNISYLPGQPSFSFVIFLLAAMLLVARLTFIQSMREWRREGVAPGEGMAFEVLVAGAVVGGALVIAAWAIPTANNWGPVSDAWGSVLAPVQERVDRLGNLFIGIGSKKPIPVHAMGGALPLQGSVALDDDVLFEVVADGEMNLRGAVYDEYTGSGWRISSAAAVALPGAAVESSTAGTPSSRAALREALRVDVTVRDESAPSEVLLAAGDPIASTVDAELVVDRAGDALHLRSDDDLATGTTYSTVGTRSIAAVETLQAAGTEYPAEIRERYLGLPGDLPPEIATLTQEVTAGAATPYEAATLIEQHLRQNYSFSLTVDTPPPSADAVGHFLTTSRTGYFDVFASSMAVMLRTVGVPARVAVGFALDDRDLNATTRAYEVSEQRAWTWPEVYFPGLGWVEFNPTPTRELTSRPGDDSATRGEFEPGLGGFTDDELLDDIDELWMEEQLTGESTAVPVDSGPSMAAEVIGWLLMVATVAALAILGVRLLWERLFRGLAPGAKRWAKLQMLATWAGLKPSTHRTASEFAGDIGPRLGEAAAVRALARSYSRVRYGGPDGAAETPEQADALNEDYRRARRVLARLIVRRVVRLGRVQGGPLTRRGAATWSAR